MILSFVPSRLIPEWDLFPGFDKLVHVCMYFGLTFLASWTLHAEENRKRILYIAFLAISWGMLMEICQLIMQDGRNFEWMDELSNSIGAIIGATLYFGISKLYTNENT
jgi:VanZ family protein